MSAERLGSGWPAFELQQQSWKYVGFHHHLSQVQGVLGDLAEGTQHLPLGGGNEGGGGRERDLFYLQLVVRAGDEFSEVSNGSGINHSLGQLWREIWTLLRGWG